MWWNSRRREDEASTALEMVKQPIVVTVVDKFRSGQVRNAINELRTVFIQLPVDPETRRRYASNVNYANFRAPYPHRREVAERFVFLHNRLESVDYQRADSRVLMSIVETLNDTIPKMLREIQTEFTLQGWTHEDYWIESLTTALENAIDKATNLPSLLSKLNTEINEGIVSGDIDFPEIVAYSEDEELYPELMGLKTDWENAHNLPMEVEDEFTIEQVALAYVPDALTLYDRFRRRTGDLTNQKAKTLLLEQLKLIRKQVQFVLEQHTEDSLSMMEAHTLFLKSKNEQLGIE